MCCVFSHVLYSNGQIWYTTWPNQAKLETLGTESELHLHQPQSQKTLRPISTVSHPSCRLHHVPNSPSSIYAQRSVPNRTEFSSNCASCRRRLVRYQIPIRPISLPSCEMLLRGRRSAKEWSWGQNNRYPEELRQGRRWFRAFWGVLLMFPVGCRSIQGEIRIERDITRMRNLTIIALTCL